MRRLWASVILLLLVAGLLVPSTMAQGPAPEAPPDAEQVPPEGDVPAPAGVGPLAVSYAYTNTSPVAVPDSSCPTYTTSQITVTDSFLIGDLNVGLWIAHTYRGDLDMYLMGPDATTVELYTDPDSGADNLNVLLDDSSPNVADSTNHTPPPPYYYAWWHPEGSLADFNNKDAQGVWTLQICDDAGGDTGTVNTWTLFFQSGLILNPADQSGSTCKGGDVVYSFELINSTGVTTSFSLAYASVWPAYGPSSTPVLASGEAWSFDVTVHIPWVVSAGDQDTLTVTASGAGDTAQATATTRAGLASGYTDYANAPRPVRDHSVVYWDGKIYSIGGYDGGYRDYLDIYDIATDTWYTGTNVPAGRDYWDCAAIDARIYCASGYNAGGQTTLYIYDIATNSWSTGAPLPEYRYTYAGVALNGLYYVIGGYGPAPSPYYKDTIWAYDPTTDSWDTTLTPMSTGRRYHAAGVIGGMIYVAGGYNGSYLSSAEVYDPTTDTWTPIASMPTSWLRGGDAVKHDRYLIIFGGDDNSSAVSSELVWAYDAVADSWEQWPSMPHELYATEADGDGTEVWITSGRLYEGGYRYSEYHFKLDQCPEACDPLTGAEFTWDPPVPWAGYEVVFTGVATGTPAIQYEWNLGDGTTGMGEVLPHVYIDAGLYTVVLTATNCDGTGQIVVTHDVQVILPPTIDVDPDSLWATQCPDEVTSQDLLICNLGDAPLEWSLYEVSPTMRAAAVPAPVGVPLPTVPLAEPPVITSPEQCAAYENYTGAEPLGAAEFCHPEIVPVPAGGPGLNAPTDIGYAQDIGYISDNFVWFYLNDFPGQTVVGLNTVPFYGMDFDPSATVLYALNDTTDELGTIDLATGTFTGLVPCPPGGGAANWTGLTIDPANGTFYGCTSSDLYIIDPATGNSTLVGPFNAGTMIEIAMNMAGEMYGHDIGTDSIYSINPGTGAATLIGPTGYAANYAQGMDFDNDDGTLYIFLYIGSGANVYGTVDLTTGAVSPLSVDNPLGEFEGAIQIPGLAVDVPWLSEDPITGTVPGGGCTTVTVSFDSTGLTPGDYNASLLIESNDPVNPEVTVPVTLTVNPPPDLELTAPPLEAEVCQDGTATIDMDLCNLGGCDLEWTIEEMSATVVFAASPAGSGATRPVELSFEAVPDAGGSVFTNPPVVEAPVSLILDDGSRDNDIGIGGTWEFIWVNRFTPDPSEFPFDLNEVQIYFSSVGLAQPGDDIIIVVYENTTGGYDPAPGSNWLLSYPTTVQAVDAWNVYPLPAPVHFDGPGDAIIGVIALEIPGTSYWPASMDQTVSQERSWAGWWLVSPPPDPPLLPPDDDWTLIDAYFPGNWMVRGYGETSGAPPVDIPWLSEDPIAGTVEPGTCQTVTVTFDATGLTPGDYFANLVLYSNDPDQPEITLPVTMTVVQRAEIVNVTYAITDLTVAFDAEAVGALPLTYTWDFGDGNGDTVEDPVYTYAEGGCYTVTLEVANACNVDVWSDLICVCEPVSIVDVTTGIEGCSVTFTPVVSGTAPFIWLWQFGDGMTSTLEMPTYEYGASGTYNVTVEVWNCADGYATYTFPIELECGYTIYLPLVFKSY